MYRFSRCDSRCDVRDPSRVALEDQFGKGMHFLFSIRCSLLASGGDCARNDLQLIDRRMPVTTTSEGKLERVYADAKVPMSHFDKMVEHTRKMFDLPNQIRSTDEEALQEAISPYRVIKTVNGNDEAIMIARVAVKEMEFEGAIRERDRARNEGFSEERIKSIQRNVDATGGRRAEDQEALDKILATEYQLGNKILSVGKF